MRKNIIKLQEMLKTNNMDKSIYNGILAETDVLVQKFLQENNYEQNRMSIAFEEAIESNLSHIMERKQAIEENPDVVVQEVTKSTLTALDSFLRCYHIGYLKRAEMRTSGVVEVEIPCSISMIGHPRESVKKQLFDMQISFLKKEGFVLQKDGFGMKIIDCETNRSLIRQIFLSRNAKSIEIHTRNDYISSVQFRVLIADVPNFHCKELVLSPINGEELDNEDRRIAYRSCVNILYALDFMMLSEKAHNVNCAIIAHEFANICDVFSFDGETRRKAHSDKKHVKEMQEEIKKLEKELCSTINAKEIPNILGPIEMNLSTALMEKTGFVIDRMVIDRYGITKINLVHSVSAAMYDADENVVENTIKRNFHHNNGTVKDETLYILDSIENKTKLEKVLEEVIPTIYIKKVISEKIEGKYCITSIDATVESLLEIITNN